MEIQRTQPLPTPLLRRIDETLTRFAAWVRGRRTFGELAQDWLERVAAQRVCPENERRHVQHMRPLWALREGELSRDRIEALFATLPLGPATLNKLRSTGSLIIRDAQAVGRWSGPDPFALVRRRRQPDVVHLTLTRSEAARVLRCLPPERRRLCRVMVWLGLRPGELLGLRKVDVDLRARTMLVRRSHGRDQTKTGRQRLLPLPAAILGDLRAAIAAHPSSPFVFPRPDGRRQRHDTKLTRMLRKALARAGIPKPLRFYDLRHTSATLHDVA